MLILIERFEPGIIKNTEMKNTLMHVDKNGIKIVLNNYS